MRIMHIDASARSIGSMSRMLSAKLVSQLQAESVDRVDLAENPPSHFGRVQAEAMYLPQANYTLQMAEAISASDDYSRRVLAVDVIVIGTPIYNFSAPSTLKAFFDHITRSGVTFAYRSDGTIQGLLSGRKVACIATFGGDYTSGAPFEGMDHLTPHLRSLFGFLGVSDLRIISVWPTLLGTAERVAAVTRKAEQEVEMLAQEWSE